MAGSQRLDEWIKSGETRMLAGHGIFVRMAATSGLPALLLVHGYPTASYDWIRIWPRLAARSAKSRTDSNGVTEAAVCTRFGSGSESDGTR